MPDPADSGTRIADLLIRTRAAFRAAGLPTADLDARLLVAEAFGLSSTAVVIEGDRAATADGQTRLADFTRRRLDGEPVGRLLGRREFWGIPFALAPDTLEPRPDTETVVEAALAAFPHCDAPLRFADLGTGTGAIAVAILSERPNAVAVGLDLAPGAVAAAVKNAASAGVGTRFLGVVGDFSRLPVAGFDLIVSNPPYITSSDMASLDRGVLEYDPALALDGGPDGLVAYRALIPAAFAALGPEGRLIVEIGAGQERDVAALMTRAGFEAVFARPDLAGLDRVIEGRRTTAR